MAENARNYTAVWKGRILIFQKQFGWRKYHNFRGILDNLFTIKLFICLSEIIFNAVLWRENNAPVDLVLRMRFQRREGLKMANNYGREG